MNLSPALLVLLTVLATCRATILLVDDEITAPWRQWVVRHRPDNGDGPEDRIVYLAHCPYCVSVYVGLGLAALTYWFGGTWPVQLLLVGLTASLAAGLVTQAKARI